MWRWVDPRGVRSKAPYRTEQAAKAAGLKELLRRDVPPEYIEALWPQCERAGWRLEATR